MILVNAINLKPYYNEGYIRFLLLSDKKWHSLWHSYFSSFPSDGFLTGFFFSLIFLWLFYSHFPSSFPPPCHILFICNPQWLTICPAILFTPIAQSMIMSNFIWISKADLHHKLLTRMCKSPRNFMTLEFRHGEWYEEKLDWFLSSFKNRMSWNP